MPLMWPQRLLCTHLTATTLQQGRIDPRSRKQHWDFMPSHNWSEAGVIVMDGGS